MELTPLQRRIIKDHNAEAFEKLELGDPNAEADAVLADQGGTIPERLRRLHWCIEVGAMNHNDPLTHFLSIIAIQILSECEHLESHINELADSKDLQHAVAKMIVHLRSKLAILAAMEVPETIHQRTPGRLYSFFLPVYENLMLTYSDQIEELTKDVGAFFIIQKRNGNQGHDASADAAAKGQWLVKAMMLVNEHPEYSNATIAKAVGVNPSQLSRSLYYQRASELARKQSPKKTGKIVSNPDSGGSEVEAVDDSLPSQEEIDDQIDRENDA